MAIALLAHAAAGSTDGAAVTTAGIDTSGASLLVLVVSEFNANTTPTDSKGNSWTKAVSTIHATNSAVAIWYSSPTSVGTGHTFSIASAVSPSICAGAFSGVVAASPLDQTNSGGAASTTAATGSVTPGQNNELLIDAVTCWGATVAAQPSSIDVGQTITDTIAEANPGGINKCYGSGLAYEIQTSATTRNPTWTCNGVTTELATAIATFKVAPTLPTGQGHGPNPGRRLDARHSLAFASPIDLALKFPVAPPGVNTRAWHWPNPMWRKSDHAARPGFLTPTNQWTVPDFSSALIYIHVNGIARAYGHASSAGSIQSGSLVVNDVLDQTPNTCDFVAQGFTPTVGMRVIMALGGISNTDRIFAGSILTVTPVYLGDKPANQVFQVHCIDDTWTLDRVKVIKTYTNMAAGEIAYDLMATYAPGFTTHHVSSDLDVIDVMTFTNTDLSACLTQLAKRVGAYWRIDYFSDLWFAETENAGADPIDLTAAHPSLSEFASSTTISDIITRCLVEGGGVNASSAVAAGDTILPLDLIAVNGVAPWYNALGGRVVCGTQRITYTGVQAGGAGSLVGPGIGPASAPTLALAAGAGVESGAHGYGVTFVTASGESLPSPVGTITTGAVPIPTVAPTLGVPSAGVGPDTGDHGYGVSFVNAAGETTIGPLAHVATTEYSAPSAAPTFLTAASGNGPTCNNGFNYLDYAIAFVSASGETIVGPRLQFQLHSVADGFQFTIQLQSLPTGPAGIVSRRIYRSLTSLVGYGGTLYQVGTLNDNTTTTYTDTVLDGSLGAAAPSTNTAVTHVVALTAIPIGDPSVTARNIYRTTAGGSVYKLAHQIADNVTATWSDTVTDASLGATAPVVNTATANRVNLSAILIGAASVTQRKVYRTVAGGSQLKLLATIADNTTTVYADSTADASLGANVPSSDTSGLTQPNGQVIAGSITLLSAGIGWASSTGGWAVIGNGQQVIRYTGYAGNTLTGIPATGIGAIVATISYNSTITAAPCLTGIPASGTGAIIYMINRGDPVNLLVQVDDTDAQAILSALLDPLNLLGGAAGIKEDYLQDGRLSETEARARGTAQLALMSRAQLSVTYKCRDPLTASGRTITINLPSPQSIAATLKIQQVTISQFTDNVPTLFPTYAVQASTVRFSFEDLLRQTRQLLNG